MKSKAVYIGVIILVAIAMFCVAPYSYWDAGRMIRSALFYNITVVIISIACLFYFNKGDGNAIAKTVFISFLAYIQLPAGFFLYRYGSSYYLPLLIMQVLFGVAIMKYAPNYKSMVIMSSDLIASTIWANRISGFMYYCNISSDLETIAVSGLIAAVGVVIVTAISICCICYRRTGR